MKKMLSLLTLLPAILLAQPDTKTEFAAYKAKIDQLITQAETKKPAACKDYRLDFVVTGKQFDESVARPAQSNTLCLDLKSYEGQKGYDIKAVSDQYYIIRADKEGGAQEFYYYSRIPAKK